MLQLLLVRHGDPDYENDCLTERGRREAMALAERMRALQPDALFSSPLGRARETAAFSEAVLGMEATVVPWAAELDELLDIPGSGHAGAVWNAPGLDLRAGLPEASAGFVDTVVSDVMETADSFLSEQGLVRAGAGYRLDPHWRPRTAVVFCHAGFATAWLAHLLDIPVASVWSSLYLAPTSVTTVLFERREPGLAAARALSIGDVSHLYGKPELENNHQGLEGLDLLKLSSSDRRR